MLQFLKAILKIVFILALLFLTILGFLALWYRLPGPDLLATVVSCGFALLGLTTIAAQFGRHPVRSMVVFVFAMAAISIWWESIEASPDGNWDASVARQVTGTIDGNILSLTNVREFEYQGDNKDDVVPKWTNRTFDLSTITTTDMFLSYWAGPTMAHFMMSFGFENNDYLVWSIEVRLQVGGDFSPIRDLFKSNNLIVLASVEKDVVGLRSNIRGEDVEIFRLNAKPGEARLIIEGYLEDANDIAERPAFYNSLTTNCTTTVLRMIQKMGLPVKFDWKIVANGFLPDLLYERGSLDTRVSLGELRSAGKIRERAQAAGLGDGFSAAIREGVPSPER